MSPISSFGLMALAGIAAAVPHAHYHHLGHQHLHVRDSSSQSHVSMPSCWSSCFQKYNVSDEDCLCDKDTGSSVKMCIDTSCKNTPGAVKQYNSWVSNYCQKASSSGSALSGTVPATTSTYTSTPSGYWTTSVWTETTTVISSTYTSVSTYLTTSTVTVPESPVTTGTWVSPTGAYSTAEAYSTAAGGWGETCGADVTVTTKVYATVTVTAGGSGAENQQTGWGWSSETEAATTSAEYSPQETHAQHTHEKESSTEEASSPSPYVPSAPTSTEAATTALISASIGGETPTSSPSKPAPTSSSAGFSKRGLAYNDAADCAAFTSSQIGWAYNWGSLPQGLDTSSVSYIPMLWSNQQPFVGYWNENAETCLSSGAEYFFSFNEPDMSSQANMSPQEAADAWMQYMEPYAGKVKLVAPAVTNGVGSGLGLDWLSQFMSACSSCTIDAVNQHWYDSTGNDVDYFKQQVGQIASQFGKPVFVSEFAGIGSEDELTSFMSEVLEWMDGEESIIGYSYYMVGDGFLNAGTGLSPLGEAYNSDN